MEWPYYQKYVCKPDNFELHNSLKLSLNNICSPCYNFVGWESFIESKSPDILHLWEINLKDSIDSSNNSMRVYLLLIRKNSVTYIHGVAVYLKEGLWHRLYFQKTLLIIIYVFGVFVVFMRGGWVCGSTISFLFRPHNKRYSKMDEYSSHHFRYIFYLLQQHLLLKVYKRRG